MTPARALIVDAPGGGFFFLSLNDARAGDASNAVLCERLCVCMFFSLFVFSPLSFLSPPVGSVCSCSRRPRARSGFRVDGERRRNVGMSICPSARQENVVSTDGKTGKAKTNQSGRPIGLLSLLPFLFSPLHFFIFCLFSRPQLIYLVLLQGTYIDTRIYKKRWLGGEVRDTG